MYTVSKLQLAIIINNKYYVFPAMFVYNVQSVTMRKSRWPLKFVINNFGK